MARLSRIVVPGYPHHVTQRGVRLMAVFHSEGIVEYGLLLTDRTLLGLVTHWERFLKQGRTVPSTHIPQVLSPEIEYFSGGGMRERDTSAGV